MFIYFLLLTWFIVLYVCFCIAKHPCLLQCYYEQNTAQTMTVDAVCILWQLFVCDSATLTHTHTLILQQHKCLITFLDQETLEPILCYLSDPLLLCPTDAFDNELIVKTLCDIMEGRTVQIPVYDFVTHSRSVQTTFWII